MGVMQRVARWVGFKATDPIMDDRYFSTSVSSTAPSGVTVTADTALKVSAVYACVRLISNAVACLPVGVYERVPGGRRELEDDPLAEVFGDSPNTYQTGVEFKRMMMGHLLLRGSCYARIVDGGPRGLSLWPLHPDRITGPELLESGRLRYEYRPENGGAPETMLAGEGGDLWALNGFTGGLRGLAMAEIARDSIGLAMATEQHGSRLFSQGVKLSGLLKHPAKLGPEAAERLRSSFSNQFAGLRGAHRVPVLEEGMEWQQIGMSNEDAQFLETRKFSVNDIARWFGVPPHLIADVERSTSWGTGIEHQSIQFVTYGLIPWLTLWEQSIRRTFIPEPGRFVRFNANALLRADIKTRYEVYGIGISKGIVSPNEVRALEDLLPREGGDEYAKAGAAQPAPAFGRKPVDDGESSPQKAPAKPDMPEPDEDDASASAGAAVAEAAETAETEWELLQRAETARRLALASAERIVGEERRAVMEAARRLAVNGKAWGEWVRSFYGRLPALISASLACEKDAVRPYCNDHRDSLLARGLSVAEEWSAGALVAACLDDKGGA